MTDTRKSKGNTNRRVTHRNNGKPHGVKGFGPEVAANLFLCRVRLDTSLAEMVRQEKLIRRWTRRRI